MKKRLSIFIAFFVALSTLTGFAPSESSNSCDYKDEVVIQDNLTQNATTGSVYRLQFAHLEQGTGIHSCGNVYLGKTAMVYLRGEDGATINGEATVTYKQLEKYKYEVTYDCSGFINDNDVVENPTQVRPFKTSPHPVKNIEQAETVTNIYFDTYKDMIEYDKAGISPYELFVPIKFTMWDGCVEYTDAFINTNLGLDGNEFTCNVITSGSETSIQQAYYIIPVRAKIVLRDGNWNNNTDGGDADDGDDCDSSSTVEGTTYVEPAKKQDEKVAQTIQHEDKTIDINADNIDVMNGVSYMPIKDICSVFDVSPENIHWDNISKTVIILDGDVTIRIDTKDDSMKAILKDGVTMYPIRNIATLFLHKNTTVDWNNDTKEIKIRYEIPTIN